MWEADVGEYEGAGEGKEGSSMSGGELFHYTSVNGVRGILESQNLQATHFRFLNDTSEISYVSPLVEQLFYEEIRDLVIADEKRFGTYDKTQRNIFVRDEAQKLFHAAFTTIEQMSPLFLLSMCKHTHKDQIRDGLLSQWRGYGKSSGYCIVFDETELKQQLDEVNEPNKFAKFDYKYVDYVSSPEEVNVSQFIGIAAANFKREFNRRCESGQIDVPENARVRYSNTETEPDLGHLLDPLLSILPFKKHSAFSEESEFRIAAAALSQEVVLPDGVSRPPRYGCRLKGSLLVPYITIFNEGLKLPIRRIVVGPGTQQNERAYGLCSFISNNGILSKGGKTIEVELSSIPYFE